MKLRRNNSERQNTEIWWLKVPERICTMALNAKLKKDGSIECLDEYEKLLWTPKLRKMVAQNAWMGMKKGSEHQNEGWKCDSKGLKEYTQWY